MNSIGEFVGMIEILIGVLILKVSGRINLKVLITFYYTLPVLLCKVVLKIALGILSFKGKFLLEVT